MISYSVKAEVEQVRRALTKAQQQVVPNAVQAALNKTVKSCHTAAVREVSSDLRVKQKDVRKKLRFQRRDKASRWNWEAGIFTVLSDVSASFFGKPRQLKKGAKAGQYYYEGAFVATMRKRISGTTYNKNKKKWEYSYDETARGPIGIWKREGKERTPIKMMREPIRDKIEKIIPRVITRVGMPAFLKNFNHEMEYRLRKLGL